MDLEIVLPKATAWAKEQQAHILVEGVPLSQKQLIIARDVEVSQPDNIRIKIVDQIPSPKDPELAAVALQTGLITPETIGLTLFYGIFICHSGYENLSIMAHEFRHTQQYEQRGSIKAFLDEYLKQIDAVGYPEAPLEQDAIQAGEKYR